MSRVVGLFETTRDVDQIVGDLKAKGFDKNTIGVMARKGVVEQSEHFKLTESTEVGAATGATIGGIGGLLFGFGALVIPGIGPVVAAGELLTVIGATVLGVGVGAASGGLVGALTSFGLPEHEAKFYSEGVKRGGILVTVQAGEDQIAAVTNLMRQDNAVDVNTRRQEWQSEGAQNIEPNPPALA